MISLVAAKYCGRRQMLSDSKANVTVLFYPRCSHVDYEHTKWSCRPLSSLEMRDPDLRAANSLKFKRVSSHAQGRRAVVIAAQHLWRSTPGRIPKPLKYSRRCAAVNNLIASNKHLQR